MKILPSLMQLAGGAAVLGSLAVLVDPWLSVLAAGAALAWYGYRLEPDDA